MLDLLIFLENSRYLKLQIFIQTDLKPLLTFSLFSFSVTPDTAETLV